MSGCVRAQIDALEKAADHLENARQYLWNNQQRRVNGWASAAAELRQLAAAMRDDPDRPAAKAKTR